MNLIRQIWAVTLMNLAEIPSRALASAVTVVGVATVVAVMISLLGVGEGVLASVLRFNSPGRVIVLSSGAPTEYTGSITPGDVAQIAETPGVRRLPDGRPMVQPRAAIIVELENKTGGGTNNVMFAGTGPIGRTMNNESFHLVEGRFPRPGLHELLAGRGAQRLYKNLDVGDHVRFRGTDWAVVGIYEDKGGIDENAISSDVDTVLAAFNRNAYQSVAVQLASPADYSRFKDALTSNPQLQVQVKHFDQYYRDQVQSLTSLLKFVGYFVGSVMALGVVFGAINTMYSAVDARAREIATLRALGFGGTAVVVSVMVEALALAVPGALIGAAIAWLLFNNHQVAMGGVSFGMAITPGLVLLGVVWALAIGLIGGFLPSIHAARLPVVDALRAT
jgi:putative ABC transport system permease protein